MYASFLGIFEARTKEPIICASFYVTTDRDLEGQSNGSECGDAPEEAYAEEAERIADPRLAPANMKADGEEVGTAGSTTIIVFFFSLPQPDFFSTHSCWSLVVCETMVDHCRMYTGTRISALCVCGCVFFVVVILCVGGSMGMGLRGIAHSGVKCVFLSQVAL